MYIVLLIMGCYIVYLACKEANKEVSDEEDNFGIFIFILFFFLIFLIFIGVF